MSNYPVAAGKKYSRLLVVKPLPDGDRWLCICDCGSEKKTRGHYLLYGDVKSCGCLRRETLAAMAMRHGKSGTTANSIWHDMRRRCLSEKRRDYYRYGGRGIVVCERWNSFENFYADMGDPLPGMSLDRIDNNGPYSPENCRWATASQQARNTRRNRLATIDGETMCLKDWADRKKINYFTLHKRITRGGWDPVVAIMTPIPALCERAK